LCETIERIPTTVRAKYWMHGETPDVEGETRRPYRLYTADATSYHKSGLRFDGSGDYKAIRTAPSPNGS
jgi:hypothetical protein